jgi:predicted bacteriocin transport accessory protein
MKKKLLMMLVGLVVLAGCSKPAGKDLYTMIDMNGIKEKVAAKEDFVFVIGRDTCPACKAYKEVLDEVIKNKKIKVYYLEIIESVWQEKDYNALSDYLERDLDQVINAYPTTYFVEGGVVTGNEIGMLNYKLLVDELVDRGLAS